MSLLATKLARDARRQAPQFAAVAVVLALGVAVFGAAFDSYDNLKTSYEEAYDGLRFADLTVTGGDIEGFAARAATLDGVARVTTRIQVDTPLRVAAPDGARALFGRVVGTPPGGDAPVNRLLVQEGRGVGDASTSVVVERHMADHFGLGVGDTVEAFGAGGWQELTVVGVAVSPEYLWPARNRQDLLTSPDDFGVLFGAPALVADLEGLVVVRQALVRYEPGADRSALDQRLAEIGASFGVGDVMPRADQPSNGALQMDVEGFGELAVLFPLLFLVAGTLAAYVLLGRLVRAQRSQIGMLAANGYPRGRLLRHYLAYGGAAGLAGGFLGAAGGVVLARWLTTTYTSSLGIPLAIARFHPLTPLVGLAAGTAAGVIAAWAPARAATRVSPAEAMRGTGPAGRARRSVVERIPGGRALPVRARMMMRNVGRSPRRSVSTGAGVVLAAVLVLSSLGMLDTVSLLVDEQFGEVQRQDAQLYLAAPPDDAILESVGQAPGVDLVERAVEAPAVLLAGDDRYETALIGFERGTAVHRFPRGLPERGLLLGRSLEGLLGVQPGDPLQVSVGGESPQTVPVAGFVDEPFGTVAYASRPEVAALAGGEGVDSLMVSYRDGADPDTMRRRLADLPGVVAVRDSRGTQQAVEGLLGFFYAIVGAMLLFGSILAFVVLFNTLSVNLSERTVELATLRAAGARVPFLARLVTGENLLLVVLAVPVGLLAGWLTGRQMLSSLETDLYHFALRLRVTTPVLVAAALLAVTLLTHWPARRGINRIDVARVVRERSL